MAHDDHIGVRGPIMLHQPFLVLAAQLLPGLPFLCHIMVNSVKPFLASFTAEHGKRILHPDIAAVPPYQAVHHFKVVHTVPNERGRLLHHALPVIRMDSRHGVLAVYFPRFFKGHRGQCRKPVRHVFRYHAAVLLSPYHSNTARQVLYHGLEIFLQPLLFPACLYLLGHIPHVFYISRNPIPVALLKPGHIKTVRTIYLHLMFLSVRRMGLL